MKNQVWAIVVAMVVALATQVSLTAAAPRTSAASTDIALQGNVRVLLRGSMEGPQFAAFGRGRFTISGAISDHGRFVEEFQYSSYSGRSTSDWCSSAFVSCKHTISGFTFSRNGTSIPFLCTLRMPFTFHEMSFMLFVYFIFSSCREKPGVPLGDVCP